MTISTEELTHVLRYLHTLDITLIVHHDGPSGPWSVTLRQQDWLPYIADPAGFVAKHYGVSKHEYLQWHQEGYCVRCAGTTKAGKRCKKIVEGGTNVTPAEWAQRTGAMCAAHAN